MSARPERTVMLLDMNAFFASIEQQCNPHLRGQPVLVCGSRSTRTVVVAASYETRPFGARSGMPLGEALRLCPNAIVIEANPPKYLDTARRLQDMLLEFSPQVEIFSIDEAFVELHPDDDPMAIARAIKAKMRERFDLTCSIGIGPNKLVAKLAAGLKKPDGLVWIKQEEIATRFASLPVSELCGIGPKVTRHLQSLGICTAGQLGAFPTGELRNRFGVFWGELLAAMGRGEDPSPVVSCLVPPVIKSVGHSYTLPRDTSSLPELRAHLLCLALDGRAATAGRRVRGAHHSIDAAHVQLHHLLPPSHRAALAAAWAADLRARVESVREPPLARAAAHDRRGGGKSREGGESAGTIRGEREGAGARPRGRCHPRPLRRVHHQAGLAARALPAAETFL